MEDVLRQVRTCMQLQDPCGGRSYAAPTECLHRGELRSPMRSMTFVVRVRFLRSKHENICVTHGTLCMNSEMAQNLLRTLYAVGSVT